MSMKLKWLGWVLIALMLGMAHQGGASLIGPWIRYSCRDLGFQIVVSDDWMVTPVDQGLVFVMQYAPKPYVRVAVGRIVSGAGGMEPMIASRLSLLHPSAVHRETGFIDGRNATIIDGSGPDGPFRDVFIPKDRYVYWIGFTADNLKSWPQYASTFSIVLDSFHFL
jgi:hypothetical protein